MEFLPILGNYYLQRKGLFGETPRIAGSSAFLLHNRWTGERVGGSAHDAEFPRGWTLKVGTRYGDNA